MSTILQVFTYRTRPGQLSNFMKNVAKGSKIIHRDGGKVRLGTPPTAAKPERSYRDRKLQLQDLRRVCRKTQVRSRMACVYGGIEASVNRPQT